MSAEKQQPVRPDLEAFAPHFLLRLRRGLRSWLNLLSEWDYQIPIGSVRFLGLNLFLVNQPAAVKRVLVDQVDQYPKHPFTLWILEPLIGRAIFSVNGPEWARQRRLLDQVLQGAQLRQVFPQMGGAVAALLARLAGRGHRPGDDPGHSRCDCAHDPVAAPGGGRGQHDF